MFILRMKLEDLLKDPTTAFWTGFISMGTFLGLYFVTLIYGKRLYYSLFKDEPPYLPPGEYEKRIRARIELYEHSIKDKLETTQKKMEKRYSKFK